MRRSGGFVLGGGCLGVVSPLHGRGVIGLEQLLGRQLQEQVLGQLSLLQKKPGPGVVVLVAGKERTGVVIGCRGPVREACAASPTSDHGQEGSCSSWWLQEHPIWPATPILGALKTWISLFAIRRWLLLGSTRVRPCLLFALQARIQG